MSNEDIPPCGCNCESVEAKRIKASRRPTITQELYDASKAILDFYRTIRNYAGYDEDFFMLLDPVFEKARHAVLRYETEKEAVCGQPAP